VIGLSRLPREPPLKERFVPGDGRAGAAASRCSSASRQLSPADEQATARSRPRRRPVSGVDSNRQAVLADGRDEVDRRHLAVRFEADHLLREPLDYLPGVGFEVDEVQRLKWGIVERLRAHRP
jgi:hypothetical protein